MNLKNQHKTWLISVLSLLAASGCSVPVCVEGNVVCMDDQNDQMTIYQSDMCEGSRCSVSQPKSCQLYRCQGETFMPIPNGSCPLGSQMQDGTLMCIPKCHDGEMVCAIQDDEEQLEIKQSSADDEGSVNETPCQKYRCSQNDYVPIENGYCSLGSHIKDGALSCIPRCEHRPRAARQSRGKPLYRLAKTKVQTHGRHPIVPIPASMIQRPVMKRTALKQASAVSAGTICNNIVRILMMAT